MFKGLGTGVSRLVAASLLAGGLITAVAQPAEAGWGGHGGGGGGWHGGGGGGWGGGWHGGYGGGWHGGYGGWGGGWHGWGCSA